MHPVRLIQVAMSHPIHVPLTHFPIGLAHVSALLAALSLFFAWRKNPEQSAFFSKALFYDLLLLILSIFPPMATGILENQTRYNGIAPNAPLKIMFASTLLVIAVVLTVWRWRKPNVMQSRAGIIVFLLCGVCAALTITLGFLGGIIVWGA